MRGFSNTSGLPCLWAKHSSIARKKNHPQKESLKGVTGPTCWSSEVNAKGTLARRWAYLLHHPLQKSDPGTLCFLTALAYFHTELIPPDIISVYIFCHLSLPLENVLLEGRDLLCLSVSPAGIVFSRCSVITCWMNEYSEKDGNLLTSLLSSARESVGEAGQK